MGSRQIEYLLFSLLIIFWCTKDAATQTTGADNIYCADAQGSQYETTNFPSNQDGWAKLPGKCVRTAMADSPQRRRITKTVCPDGGCDFRNLADALEAANQASECGWAIKVQARDPSGGQRV